MIFKVKTIALSISLVIAASANAADFTNGGFESNSLTDWTSYGGQWNGSPVAPIDPSVYMTGGANYDPTGIPQIQIVTPSTDASAGGTNTVFDGGYAVRVNDNSNDNSVSVLTQTVNSYDGTSINFAWSAVLEGSHGLTDSDHFVIKVYDNTRQSQVALISYSSASAADVFTNNGGIYYSGWRGESIRTTPGNSYTLSILVADCPYGGHWGYVYLDAFSVNPLTGIPVNVFIPPGPDAADTISSMNPNAYALRGSFANQSAVINAGLSYDCNTFDKNGICVSAGGRVTDTNNPSTNTQGALLIAAYRPNQNWRIGGYLDQNLSSNDARGINLDNANPMGGLFAVWNQNTDGTGYQLRLSTGYSYKDITIGRSAFGLTGEAGKGDSSLQSQAYSAILSRGFQISDSRWIASPYLGVRYTKIKRAGYTEDGTVDVTTPLTYSALSQEATTALVGVRFNGQFADKVNVMASVGIENDIAHNTGDYAATGVDGLTPIAFNQNIRHMRPVAQAGIRYAVDKRQTVGASLGYRQEAFNSTHSVTGMVNYEIGF